MKKKIYLIDAFAIIYRAYFAFGNNQRYNSQGLNTSATLGFTNSLLDILNNQKPDYIGVAFDPSGGTFRNEIFPEYKANRQEMPEDIRKAIPYVKKIVEGFNIPIIEVKGFEADDVIGTLAKKAEKEGLEVYMMTPDKDYAPYAIDGVSPVIGEIGIPRRSGQPVVIKMPGGIGSQIIQRGQRTQPLPHPLIQHAAGEQGVVTGLVHEHRQPELAPRQQCPNQQDCDRVRERSCQPQQRQRQRPGREHQPPRPEIAAAQHLLALFGGQIVVDLQHAHFVISQLSVI